MTQPLTAKFRYSLLPGWIRRDSFQYKTWVTFPCKSTTGEEAMGSSPITAPNIRIRRAQAWRNLTNRPLVDRQLILRTRTKNHSEFCRRGRLN